MRKGDGEGDSFCGLLFDKEREGDREMEERGEISSALQLLSKWEFS